MSDFVVDKGGNPGFTASFYHDSLMKRHGADRNSPTGHFLSHMNSPIDDPQSVRLTAKYTPRTTGQHYLGFSCLGPSKIWVEDDFIYESNASNPDPLTFVFGNQDEIRIRYHFQAGRSYTIKVETLPIHVDAKNAPSGEHVHELLNGTLGCQIGFLEQGEMEADDISEAVEVASKADLALVFVGNTAQWEAEGKDKLTMSLPVNGSQNDFIKAVAKANPRTIVINATGHAIDVSDWLSTVSGFVQAWYAGQETGNSIVDVLLGDACPSGKLPISWPRLIQHTACYGHFGMDSYESKEVQYIEGINVGYRHFDSLYGTEQEVLFPFGYGLSYTTFEISDAMLHGNINEDRNAIVMDVGVANTGTVAGSEVVQIYLEAPVKPGVERPVKELVGFEKISLNVGERQKVSVSIFDAAGAYWDEESSKWRVESGSYIFHVGTSSHPRDLKLKVQMAVSHDFAFGP